MNLYKKQRLTASEKSDKDVLDRAAKRYEICSQVCEEIYRDAVDDIKFSIGEQWNPDSVADRGDRPCLVENRLDGMVHQVINEMRQNRPMLNTTPRDNAADEDTSEVISGIVRYIQYNSDSETAFDTAREHQVRGGIGFYRVCTDYVDDESFDQEILVDRIPDLRSVKFPIHLCTKVDFRDAPYCFVESDMAKDDFKEEYPNEEPDDFASEAFKGWVTEDKVRVCEYFEVEKKKVKTIYRWSDNTVSDSKPEDGLGIEVVDERDVFERKICWYKITASKILERGTIPGRWIPIIPMLGNEVCVDGKKKYLSLTRNAKDPQRMLNYWRSAEAERIALAPKAKWVMYEGQDENFTQEWLDAHKSNNPILHAKLMVEGGQIVPLPQRQSSDPMDMAIVNASHEAVDAIKACTGIYDASLGAQGNEQSGKAINARQKEGDTANFHFPDNEAKSLKHCCRVIIDMIPEVYDTERAIRILGEDMKEKIQKVNMQYSADGKLYDLTAGRYDAIVETGPSYMSKRQEAADAIANLGQKDPVLIASMRDLLAKFMDLPTEVVERLRKTIDPALLEDNKDGENPEAVKAQLAQATATVQQLELAIEELSGQLDESRNELAGKQMDNETKLMIAKLQANVDLIIAGMKEKSEQIKMAHEVGMESIGHHHGMERGEVEADRAAKLKPPQPGAKPEKKE